MDGTRFGRLLVVETFFNYKNSKRKFCRCICDCGNEKIIDATSLNSGATKSCGCLETESRYNRRHGKFSSGDIIAGFTLVKETAKRESNQAIIWECKCNVCGNTIEACPSIIKRNNVQSCGCNYVHPLLRDLTNKEFGFLTVQSLVKRKKRNDENYRRVMWNCLCMCGNMCIVSGDMLVSGAVTSCGCRVNKSARVEMIKKLLDEKQIKYVVEHRFTDCREKKPLPFDFYLEDLNTVIEYDGRQHFKAVDFWGGTEELTVRQRHDEIKNKYCDDNGIKVIRIPYYYKDEEIIHIINNLEPVTSKRPA